MSVQEQITRISGAKTSIAEAIAAKGVSVPTGTKIDGMAPLIANISEGEELDAELAEQDNLIAQIQTALEGKAAGSGGGSGGASAETCTVEFAGYPETECVYYSNGSEIVRYDEYVMPGTVLTVAKNSIIYIYSKVGYDDSYTILVTNGEVLTQQNVQIVVAIYGDCVITL